MLCEQYCQKVDGINQNLIEFSQMMHIHSQKEQKLSSSIGERKMHMVEADLRRKIKKVEMKYI